MNEKRKNLLASKMEADRHEACKCGSVSTAYDGEGDSSLVDPVTDRATALRGSCPFLFLTLAQNIVLPSSCQRFVSEHVDFPKTRPPTDQSYCKAMMRRLSLTHSGCRPSNTFIHAPTRQVGAICSRKGRCVYPSLNQCDSLTAFRLTTCLLVFSPRRPPRCIYREIPQTRRIRVACNQQQQPVHFLRIL
ncbi:ribonuclease-like [Mauremys mutica]|uniref:ribonuclease-like n=1 Tax=Mauremys mutica TaxID=74926 RepID=UPI001D16A751|nr:ribonuclease-like [Mauremys mutica]